MGERWDRDRFVYERDRDVERDRYYEDDRYSMRGARSNHGRDHSDERHDRRYGRGYEDDYVRDRRYYEEDRDIPRREPPSEAEYRRRVVIDKELDREYERNASPQGRRPVLLRRQSSLDTFDRRPLRQFSQREEYGPPARREDVRRDDFRAPPYTPIPLPKSKGLPPPRRYRDEAERDYYADEEFRAAYPERIHEREIIKEKRDTSRESRATRARTHRGSSRSSSSSSSSRTGGTSVRSEYPKKGKTRIPARLVSKRALFDLEYPYVEEGTTIIVQKALGQENIDQLLKLSEDYNKAEAEIAAAKSAAGNIREERREERREEIIVPPPPPPAAVIIEPPPTTRSPVIVDARGRYTEVEVDKTIIRDVSPARTSYSGHHHHHHHHHDEAGPVAVIERSRSRSRNERDIRHEIRALERELAHRPRGEISEREIVRTERLPDGQLVVYEEEVEREVTSHKPPRIEKDKKGPNPRLMRAMLSTLT